MARAVAQLATYTLNVIRQDITPARRGPVCSVPPPVAETQQDRTIAYHAECGGPGAFLGPEAAEALYNANQRLYENSRT